MSKSILIPDRVIIFPKDVENISGKKPRTARAMLQNVRRSLGKSRNQFITVKEFCEYYGIKEQVVRSYL